MVHLRPRIADNLNVLGQKAIAILFDVMLTRHPHHLPAQSQTYGHVQKDRAGRGREAAETVLRIAYQTKERGVLGTKSVILVAIEEGAHGQSAVKYRFLLSQISGCAEDDDNRVILQLHATNKEAMSVSKNVLRCSRCRS